MELIKAENALHEQRNLFGVLWSLRQLCAALDPSPYVIVATHSFAHCCC